MPLTERIVNPFTSIRGQLVLWGTWGSVSKVPGEETRRVGSETGISEKVECEPGSFLENSRLLCIQQKSDPRQSTQQLSQVAEALEKAATAATVAARAEAAAAAAAEPEVAAAASAAAAAAAAAVTTTIRVKLWKRKMLSAWSFKDLSCGRDFTPLGRR